MGLKIFEVHFLNLLIVGFETNVFRNIGQSEYFN